MENARNISSVAYCRITACNGIITANKRRKAAVKPMPKINDGFTSEKSLIDVIFWLKLLLTDTDFTATASTDI